MAKITTYKCDACMEPIAEDDPVATLTLSDATGKWEADLCQSCGKTTRDTAASFRFKSRAGKPGRAPAASTK